MTRMTPAEEIGYAGELALVRLLHHLGDPSAISMFEIYKYNNHDVLTANQNWQVKTLRPRADGRCVTIWKHREKLWEGDYITDLEGYPQYQTVHIRNALDADRLVFVSFFNDSDEIVIGELALPRGRRILRPDGCATRTTGWPSPDKDKIHYPIELITPIGVGSCTVDFPIRAPRLARFLNEKSAELESNPVAYRDCFNFVNFNEERSIEIKEIDAVVDEFSVAV